jgi:hypothetical protein
MCFVAVCTGENPGRGRDIPDKADYFLAGKKFEYEWNKLQWMVFTRSGTLLFSVRRLFWRET